MLRVNTKNIFFGATAMPEREIARFSFEWFKELVPYLWALFWSILAGVVQYIEKLRNGYIGSWRDLFYDLIVCSFVGWLTMLICNLVGIVGDAQAVVIAISAHMGTRALAQYEQIRNRMLNIESIKGGEHGST